MGTHRRAVESNPVNWSSLLRIPKRVRRQSGAREALSLSPLMQAGWADASGVERVPLVPAGAKPFVVLAGRQTAERVPNTWTGRIVALLLLSLAIQNSRVGGIVRDGAHAR